LLKIGGLKVKIFNGKNVPIKSWCNNPEKGVLEQAFNLASLPFIHKQVNLMPDTHQGYGMPIGGVIGTYGVIIPNAVGVDIGCGMCAVKTSLVYTGAFNQDKLKDIMGEIRKVIPVGFSHHKIAQDFNLLPEIEINEKEYPIVNQEYFSALKQLGTLGGGNHFIEIQKDESNSIWIMIHSGSRNLGYKVAKHYNKVAQEINERYYSKVDKKLELAFLVIGTKEAKRYIDEMNYCLEFAYANRLLMMKRIIKIFQDTFNLKGGAILGNYNFESPKDNGIINIHHNYATLEGHFGKNVWVHRKGATSAKKGEIGIIPGSQGTASYIVKGKGNKESFMSCSHGAGRKMSRSKARNELNLEQEQKILEDKGIIHSIRNKKSLDEASSAYKDIDVVMEEQKDLIDVLVKLEPLAVIKG
jgi:tRNA-splicing ligase RtcB